MYLLSYFTGNGEDGLHLAYSVDGLRYTALNDGASVLAPCVGESRLMRDPCVHQASDGTFHLVWTTSWQGCTIGYSCSTDLVNWAPQRAIPVMANEPACRNCWAPEMAFDARTGQFVLFWASTVTGRFMETQQPGTANHRLYCTATRDFRSFTPTELFYDPASA